MGRGVGIASLVCSFFGTVWLLVGLRLLGISHLGLWRSGAIILGLTLVVPAVVLVLSSAPTEEERKTWQAASGKQFRTVVNGQWIAIVLAILLLNVTQHVELIPLVLSGIVGVHFVLLGSVLHLLSYRVIGSAILIADFSVLFLPQSTRYASVALGTGVILLCGSLYWMLWLKLAPEANP